MTAKRTPPGPVVFGEVLFDCFPDRRVLGGAPFNVAWNLHGLGQAPLFVGAVGEDDNGAEVRRTLSAWGMDLSGLQQDPLHPTGTVQVRIENDEPSYEIVPDQAYDHIAREPALKAVAGREQAILYHGSLALRQRQSRDTLLALREHLRARVFLDVNLRAPWWDARGVHELMQGATWVKLNEQELDALVKDDGEGLKSKAWHCLQRFDLAALIVTRAAEGALVVSREGRMLSRSAPPVDGLVDTVGAGDAFSAVTLMGLMHGWDWEEILDRAAGFAAKVCTLRGATSQEKGFYRL
ncbi:carbohydrate kinase family protein [Thioalkalivibrio sulfidiphilus]|uniref:carbohydrate kinase family protein n=1 Tax=Thioalkalivibrio sulfidiphilus TaxID=1033854 RepID=UPI00057171B2|nr:carbohydrate kinase [Thioalkalivibrio sulfidiphilus]